MTVTEESVRSSGYKPLRVLFNDSEELLIGPNNLLQRDKIEAVTLYEKLVYSQDQLEALQNERDVIHLMEDDEDPSTDSGPEPISNHLIGFLTLGKLLTSHMNVVHGGALATLIDEFFVKVALPLTPDGFAVTANLEVKYIRPVKFEPDERTMGVILECFIDAMKEHRKFRVRGYLRNAKTGAVYCEGKLLVVVPRSSLS